MSRPPLNAIPFARDGIKNTIPPALGASGQATMVDGFPAETMTPIASGGVPPSGQDVNGILYQLSQHQVWLNSGGMYAYNASHATNIGGYPIGAVLQSADGQSAWLNTVDGNMTDPDGGSAAGWKAFAGDKFADRLLSALGIKIGDIFHTTTHFADSAAVAAHLGYGTWARMGEGKVLVGYSTQPSDPAWTKTMGGTFGEYTHTLSLDETPVHQHGQRTDSDAGTNQPQVKNTSGSVDGLRGQTDPATTGKEQVMTDAAGGGQPHNNVQPSVVIAYWVRTA